MEVEWKKIGTRVQQVEMAINSLGLKMPLIERVVMIE